MPNNMTLSDFGKKYLFSVLMAFMCLIQLYEFKFDQMFYLDTVAEGSKKTCTFESEMTIFKIAIRSIYTKLN